MLNTSRIDYQKSDNSTWSYGTNRVFPLTITNFIYKTINSSHIFIDLGHFINSNKNNLFPFRYTYIYPLKKPSAENESTFEKVNLKKIQLQKCALAAASNYIINTNQQLTG